MKTETYGVRDPAFSNTFQKVQELASYAGILPTRILGTVLAQGFALFTDIFCKISAIF